MKTKSQSSHKKPVAKPVAKPLKKVQAKQPAAPSIEADIPAEETQSDINARVNNALIEFEAKIKRLESIVAELQKLPTAIAPQTQSQTSILNEITTKLGEANSIV